MAAGGSSSSAQPEKLMKGLQLDKKSLTSTSQEVGNGQMEIDMRNEASVLNFTCALDICSHIILSLSFQRIKTQTEIRKLSIRRRPERGWPRGDHSVHDERRCERREVMLLSPLFEISQFGFVFLPFLCVPRVLLCVCARVNGRVFTFVRVCAF